MPKLRNRTFAFLLSAALIPTSVFAAKADGGAVNNTPNGAKAAMAPAAATAQIGNHGHFVCTAAINSNGTVFSGEYVDASQTQRLSTGTYQVVFNTSAVSADAPCSDVRIATGWYRVCQPDTLTIGSLSARSCIVADRCCLANNAGIWIQIFDANGALVDTPFTLSASR
jgi:hypothetical protein